MTSDTDKKTQKLQNGAINPHRGTAIVLCIGVLVLNVLVSCKINSTSKLKDDSSSDQFDSHSQSTDDGSAGASVNVTESKVGDNYKVTKMFVDSCPTFRRANEKYARIPDVKNLTAYKLEVEGTCNQAKSALANWNLEVLRKSNGSICNGGSEGLQSSEKYLQVQCQPYDCNSQDKSVSTHACTVYYGCCLETTYSNNNQEND